MKAAYVVVAIVSALILWAGGQAYAQLQVQRSSECFGSWYLVKVDFSPQTKAQIREQLGMGKGEFSESKFEKNWNWIQRNIDNGRHTISIESTTNVCNNTNPKATEFWPDWFKYTTGCNSCIGCGEINDGILKMNWAECTMLGCDIEDAIFKDLRGPLPIRLVNDTLVIGSSETRCIYYLTRLNGK